MRIALLAGGLATATLASLAVLAIAPGPAVGEPPSGAPAGAAVADLRRVLAPYRDEAAALADGFIRTDRCSQGPDGGMGFHYVNPKRMRAPLDTAEPQILLYRDGKDGSRELSGAEFFARDRDQNLATDGDRPSLFGQPFEGPMPGHEDSMPIHYDLHVWTDYANPAGTFAPWNPKVSC